MLHGLSQLSTVCQWHGGRVRISLQQSGTVDFGSLAVNQLRGDPANSACRLVCWYQPVDLVVGDFEIEL
jgi:hypothetical protein